MNNAKVMAYVWASLATVLNILQLVAPILPKQWGDLLTAVFGLLTFYHIYQSHTPAALGASGYSKS